MAYPGGYAPFSYGQNSQQQSNPYYNFPPVNSYNPFPYAANSTPRYPTNGGYLPQTPYNNQVPFPGSGYPVQNHGTPYPSTLNNLQPEASPAPFIPPMPEDAKLYHHHSKKSHSKSASVPAPIGGPIKSAMKRSATVMPASVQQMPAPERKRTGSFGTKQTSFQTSSSPVTRTRTKSDVKASFMDVMNEMDHFESSHMFVYFHGNNEFVVEYVTAAARQEIREHLVAMWKEGLEEVRRSGPHLHVKFRGTPWNMSGPDKGQAWKMIVGIFRIFSIRGYGLSTVINLGFPPPRLVFCKQPRDNGSNFFLAFFSKNGYRVTFVNHPQAIDTSVVTSIHKAFPGFVDRSEYNNNIRVLELSKEVQKKSRKILEGSSREFFVEPSYFLTRVLQAVGDVNRYRIECTLPLGTSSSTWTSSSRSPSDIGSPKEIYVFGGIMTA